MDIPESMKEELGRWNNGAGIDLRSWMMHNGSYGVAVSYLTLFWPEFVEHKGYVLRKGFSESALRSFERQTPPNRKGVEWVMNHIHLADLHYHDHEGLSEDKIIVLGRALKEIYEAKLAREFPHAPCVVEFQEADPGPGGDLLDYQLSFWQACP